MVSRLVDPLLHLFPCHGISHNLGSQMNNSTHNSMQTIMTMAVMHCLRSAFENHDIQSFLLQYSARI